MSAATEHRKLAAILFTDGGRRRLSFTIGHGCISR